MEVIGMSATTALLTLGAIWFGVGLLFALVMGRHGHDPFAWWLLGTASARWRCRWVCRPSGAP
jgi:hypothetical protein